MQGENASDKILPQQRIAAGPSSLPPHKATGMRHQGAGKQPHAFLRPRLPFSSYSRTRSIPQLGDLAQTIKPDSLSPRLRGGRWRNQPSSPSHPRCGRPKRMRISPTGGSHQAERRAGNGRPGSPPGQTGLNATHCASSSITKPIRLCPPSNRTAEPVKHPLIPPQVACSWRCPLLLWFG